MAPRRWRSHLGNRIALWPAIAFWSVSHSAGLSCGLLGVHHECDRPHPVIADAAAAIVGTKGIIMFEFRIYYVRGWCVNRRSIVVGMETLFFSRPARSRTRRVAVRVTRYQDLLVARGAVTGEHVCVFRFTCRSTDDVVPDRTSVQLRPAFIAGNGATSTVIRSAEQLWKFIAGRYSRAITRVQAHHALPYAAVPYLGQGQVTSSLS